MEENQGVHEHGQAGGLHKDKCCGQNREMQVTAFEIIQFLAVQRTHDVLLRLPSTNGRA